MDPSECPEPIEDASMAMSKTKRGVLIGIGLVGFLIAVEVGLNVWRGSQACIEVVNSGSEPIEDLVITLGSSRAVGGRLEPGQSVSLYLSARKPGTLLMTFHQRGNPLGSFPMHEFDPNRVREENFKVILNVRPNEIERSQDDADPATPLGRLIKALMDRINRALEISR
jgi:hypothetical protein